MGLVARESHPDLIVVERSGPSISRDQARSVVERASLTPVEGDVKVLVLTEFHLVADAAPILLKAIEEPTPGTYFIVIADDVPAELVTIASRCVRIDFTPVAEPALAARLVAEGVAGEVALDVARASGGDLRRARLLATDQGLAERVATWNAVPGRLDGTGTTVMAIVDDITAMIDRAQQPIDAQHADEIAALKQRIQEYGERGSGSKAIEERHRRERRRLRSDELRFGLGLLATAYRDQLVASTGSGRGEAGTVAAISEIHRSVEAIERNAGERLMLLALLVKLCPDLRVSAP